MKLTMGERLKDLRSQRGMTIKEVCEALESQFSFTISPGKYNEIEGDKDKDFGYRAFIPLAKFFNVSVDYLIGLNDIPSPDYSVQAAHEVTGLSGIAVETLSRLSANDTAVLSEVLESHSLRLLRVLSLIQQKAFHGPKKASNPLQYEKSIPIELHGGSIFTETESVLLDTLIQTEVLRLSDDVCQCLARDIPASNQDPVHEENVNRAISLSNEGTV